MARKRLGELLVQAGVIDDMQLRAALGEQRKWGRPLGAILMEMNVLDEQTLVNALSQQLNVPAVNMATLTPSSVALQFLDGQFCLKSMCLPFQHVQKGNFLDVAMVDPTNQDTFDRIRLETRCNVRPFVAGAVALEALIRKHYFGQTVRQRPPTSENRPFFPPEASSGSSPGIDPSVSGGMESISYAPPVNIIDDDGTISSPDLALDMDVPSSAPAPSAPPGVTQELAQLREEIGRLNALVERDEKVIRKLMALLVEKGLCTKQELMARITQE
jgi:type IV pilus assembly protein PilB